MESDDGERIFRRMRPWMLGTDAVMALYWSMTAIAAVGLVSIPEAYLFRDYHLPQTVAWNWSFLPLDLIFIVLGFSSAVLFARSDARWLPLALLSASLTFCAGLMAISYWAILGDFDPSWWIPNLVLMIWPLVFVPGLVRATGTQSVPAGQSSEVQP